ncbi:MAG TPA: zinc ribbon domain-containing protein [Deltaproteobacteria bacterium]|nr:zinc ribbon domain-containing protein [Deltaproteobacteria bacterium]HQI81309.1 zinc ribbon domain-containing protein [Deltaproteobacteria bacterium]
MPIYEYECTKCGKVFEALVPMGAKDAPPCPTCSSRRVKKKISMIATGKGGCTSCASSSCSSKGFS